MRNLGGLTRFLDLAAEYAGSLLNYSPLGKEAGLPVKTVQSCFELLEDTLIGFRLDAWTRSPLKRLTAHPKFYLFDNGVTNALAHRLDFARPGILPPGFRGGHSVAKAPCTIPGKAVNRSHRTSPLDYQRA